MSTALFILNNVELDGSAQQTVNARDLFEFLEVKTRFNDWIERRIQDFDFVEGKDFCSFLSKSTGGRPSKEFALSISMAKELSMIERNAKGKEARQYFIECERLLRQSPAAYALPDFTNPAIAARAWADEVEKRQALELEIKENAPKINWCDTVIAANDEMTITKAAKLINYPPRKLKDFIRSIGWLYAKSDTPMQSAITSGYMVVRFAHWTDGQGNPVEKPYAHVTNKGLYNLYERLRKAGQIVDMPRLN